MMNPSLAEGARARCRREFLFVSDGHVLSAIAVSPQEPPWVRIAVEHLRGDLRRLTCREVPLFAKPPGEGDPPCVVFVATLTSPGVEERLCARGLDASPIRGRPEAFLIQRLQPRKRTEPHLLTVIGADSFGTRRAVYRLCERLGMDPMRPFSGYESGYRPEVAYPPSEDVPEPEEPLIGDTPPVRWRGVFINDEERIKTWFTENPYDLAPEAWERIFETVVRSDGNLLAPPMLYTDYMPPEIRQRCHEYGIWYTASHMEMLLFNPQCPQRPGHWPDPREVPFDYLRETERMEAAWRESVRRHRGKFCVWPLGIRGAMDEAMANRDLSPEEQAELTERVVRRQLVILEEELGRPLDPDRDPTSITLYREVLDLYNTGRLRIPPETIVVWPDDNYGRMRQLPTESDRSRNPRNGAYYHVGYCRSQWTPFVGAERIRRELGGAIQAGCTDLVLVNVSDAREFIHGWRTAMMLCTQPEHIRQPARQVAHVCDRTFWATYLGERATGAALLWRRLIALIHRRIPYWHMLHASQTLDAMRRHLEGASRKEPFAPPAPISRDAETGPPFEDAEWDAYDLAIEELRRDAERFAACVPERARQVFHDQFVVYLVVTDRVNRWVRGVLSAARALALGDRAGAADALRAIAGVLDAVSDAYRRAAWGPFKTWYRGDWHDLYVKGFIGMDQESWSLNPARSEGKRRAVLDLLEG